MHLTPTSYELQNKNAQSACHHLKWLLFLQEISVFLHYFVIDCTLSFQLYHDAAQQRHAMQQALVAQRYEPVHRRCQQHGRDYHGAKLPAGRASGGPGWPSLC